MVSKIASSFFIRLEGVVEFDFLTDLGEAASETEIQFSVLFCFGKK